MGFQRKWRAPDARPLSADEALQKLERFCLFRERCPQEVRDKIRELRLPVDMGDQLFKVLEEDRYFDEARFTELYVRSKIKGWGRVRIRMELQMRKIDPECMERYLQAIDEEAYLETLRKMLEKKYHQWTGDPQARQKAAAAVVRAGFEPELVFQCARQLPRPDADRD